MDTKEISQTCKEQEQCVGCPFEDKDMLEKSRIDDGVTHCLWLNEHPANWPDK